MTSKLVLVSATVISESSVALGTSGVRGLVTHFTPYVGVAFAVSFIAGMKRNFNFIMVATAIENCPSSCTMAQASTSALKQLNRKVIYYGLLATPALTYVDQEDKIPAIMVTNSYIPFARKGLKFYRPDGEISKAVEQVITTEHIDLTSLAESAELTVNNREAEEYVTRYTSLFKTPSLTGKRIGIYERSSAGHTRTCKLISTIGF